MEEKQPWTQKAWISFQCTGDRHHPPASLQATVPLSLGPDFQSVSAESLNDRKEAGTGLGSWGSSGLGQGAQLERKRLSAAARSLPFCLLPSVALCPSLGGCPGLPWACLLCTLRSGKCLPRDPDWDAPGQIGSGLGQPRLSPQSQDPPHSPVDLTYFLLSPGSGWLCCSGAGDHCKNTLVGNGIAGRFLKDSSVNWSRTSGIRVKYGLGLLLPFPPSLSHMPT